jgi:type IV pilus assembly protein PilC
MAMMIFIIPTFQAIFADMGSKMPALTATLLNFSHWIKDRYGWAVMLGVPFGIIVIFKLVKASPVGRYYMDVVKLRLPVFGKIIEKTAVARFTRTLGTLLAAGVPILEALTITRDTAGNEAFSQALAKVHDAIREGETFAEPLRQARIVEGMVVNMIDVGEETGELDNMLTKIADTYDEEVEVLVSSMVSLLEPAMIIILGLIVGFIVIALFLPLVSMIQNVSGS